MQQKVVLDCQITYICR